ncbi:hypothetical protein C4546_04735 [Candidatus Parcubacteria bacterium]|jgi:transcription elongation GreA/GreB family factor|nr:MAG: hypothetical protein C4546_04735 [Candidatus Parcubacteria bacterium]
MPEKNIEIGDIVELTINDRQLKLQIVNGPGDISQGVISAIAPLGQAILGRKAGDVCSVTVHPPKVLKIEIKKVI